MPKAKISLITTVFNEEKTIREFIESINLQTTIPDEVVIVDAQSRDNTLSLIKAAQNKYKKLNIKLYVKKGNRSVGRNYAIKKSNGSIILISDSGNVLDKNWVKNITKPFNDNKTDVVAGYYKGLAGNNFQKSLIPYVLVMPDKIDENNFLPATRSMAIRKSVWGKANGFDEKLSHNEDFAFANKLKKINSKIVFAKDAIVNWIPRNTLKETFIMFFRFALGDAQAKIFRDKAIFILLRYLFALYLIGLIFILRTIYYDLTIILFLFLYIIWSIWKNYKYVNSKTAFLFLPLIQFTSDFAIIAGTVLGILDSISKIDVYSKIKKNKALIALIGVYVISVLSVIEWGIPNLSHPFNYHMDEWHFSQALHTFFKDGTGSVSGAASIPFYHIVSSIIFLLPFYILKIVNPFAIKYTVDNLPMQHILFEALRMHTLLYGVGSIILVFNILKKYVKSSPVFFTSVFIFSPIFIMLSNYYKYDVTLIFWILATIYFIFKFRDTQRYVNFMYAGIACALALSTKFTAAPVFISYGLSFFIFAKEKKYKYLVMGLLLTLFIFAFTGIPDLIFGKGNYFELLYSTLVQGPQASAEYLIGVPTWFFLSFKEFPSIFGYFLTVISYLGFIYLSFIVIKDILSKKILSHSTELFILITFAGVFISSTAFGIDGGGNRGLVLLPFMVLVSALFIKSLRAGLNYPKYRTIFWLVACAVLLLQIAQTISWQSVKWSPDPRAVSSKWILKNIPSGSLIGIENIPIYQMLPDIALKEYYFLQHNPETKTVYKYKVISPKDTLPKYVVITNDFDNMNYIKESPKKSLVAKLNSTGYKKIKDFSPNLSYYNLFSDKLYLIVTNIMPVPVSISVYEKQ